MEISGKTKVVALFGYPVGHTLSPVMHNAAFAELGMDNIYLPFQVAPGELAGAVQAIRSLGFAGVNVTVPHKVAVMEYLDEVDEEARGVGAVNTIVNDGGKLTGYNTDGRGFIRSLKEDAGLGPAGMRVFVCGAGGAARGVGFALAYAGAGEVHFADIDGPKRDRLVSDINSALGSKVAYAAEAAPGFVREFELVVQATPLGMKPDDPAPMPDGSFREGQLVYDVVYNPARTKTVAAAEKAGAKTASGLGMLMYQGVLAFEHWFGRTPPAGPMKKALLENL